MIAAGTAAVFGKILQIATAAFIGFSLPLCLTIDEVGLFFLAQATITLGALVAQLGLNHTLPFIVGRSIAEGDPGRARLVVIIALRLCVLSGAIISVCLVGVSKISPHLTPTIEELSRLIPILIPLIVMTALVGLIAELQRSIFRIVAASFLPVVQSAGVSLVIAGSLLFQVPLSVERLLEVSVAVLAAALVWGVSGTWRTVRQWAVPPKTSIRTRNLLEATWPNLVGFLAFAAAAQLDIWVISVNGNMTDSAFYGVALRFSALLAIPITVIALTIHPHIVTNWTLRRRRYLQWLLTLSATAATFIVAMGVLVFAVIGKDVIRVAFGEKYEAAFLPALILGLGQVFFAAGGMAGYILAALGRQKLAMKTLLAIAAATVLMAVVAMRLFGIAGVALVYAGSAAGQALINTILVKRHFGLRTNAVVINPVRVLRILKHRSGSGTRSTCHNDHDGQTSD